MYDDVKFIPVNGELFLMFRIVNLKFNDSFQFWRRRWNICYSCFWKAANNISRTPQNTSETRRTRSLKTCTFTVTWRTGYSLRKQNYHLSTTFTTRCWMNYCLQKTTSVRSRYEAITVRTNCANFTIITYYLTSCCWQAYSNIRNTYRYKRWSARSHKVTRTRMEQGQFTWLRYAY